MTMMLLLLPINKQVEYRQSQFDTIYTAEQQRQADIQHNGRSLTADAVPLKHRPTASLSQQLGYKHPLPRLG